MKYNCPRCNKGIDIKKNRLSKCTCGAKLLAVQINKKITIQDVTPEYDGFNKELLGRGQIERN